MRKFIPFILIWFLVACSPIYVVVTPTTEPTPNIIVVTATSQVTSTPVVATNTPTRVAATEDPTPTMEVLSDHQQCARDHSNACYVNENPMLINGPIVHTIWNGRNTDIPYGYRFAPTTSPSPFIYCYNTLPGCRFEFQWLQGRMGYQAEDVRLYPDTVYLVKLRYSINAACHRPGECGITQLSLGSAVFINEERFGLVNQPVAGLIANNREAVWAFRLRDRNYTSIAAVQVFLQVQWATFANPAHFIIHEIGIIAQPSDYQGFVYSI